MNRHLLTAFATLAVLLLAACGPAAPQSSSATSQRAPTTGAMMDASPTTGAMMQGAPTVQAMIPGTPTTGAMMQGAPTAQAMMPGTPTGGAMMEATSTAPAMTEATPTTGAMMQGTPTPGAMMDVTPTAPAMMEATPTGGAMMDTLPRQRMAPDVSSDTWLNSAPLSSGDLRGKVVLVDFWTFDCINCRNTLPALLSWYDKYHDQGLVIVGVHSPEFTHEHDVANVKQAIKDLHIPYAVALDNDFKTWNAYRVYAWPTWFIVDKQGYIRYMHIGEGAYVESEQAIVQLLKQ